MKLFYLNHVSDEYSDALDVKLEFVIRAETVGQARQLAAQNAGDEGADYWRDPTKTSCELLTHAGAPCVIISHARGF